jgi:phosphate transport system protein
MTGEILEKKIEELLHGVVTLGGMVEKSALDAVNSLVNGDMKLAKKVYAGDNEINQRRFDLQTQALIFIATQQPMARDLRVVAAVLDIISELERMGDYAKGIARINIMMGDEKILKPMDELLTMAELAVSMLHRAIEAFIFCDEGQARSIPNEDDEIDILYNKVYSALLNVMMDDPSMIDSATYLLWASHNLERFADRVTNVCERTIFVITGKLIQLDMSDDEYRKLIS